MVGKSVTALAIIAACAASPAQAAQQDELRELREQLRQLREQYEQRIQALERRLEQVQGTTPAVASADLTAPQPARPTGESAFNPGISLILNGTAGNLSQDPGAYPRTPAGYRINGFVPSMGEVQPPRRGPSLGESELTVSSNIDPQFRGVGIVALSPDDTLSVEEAYVQTLSLPAGLTLKAGRFLSGVGYLNEIHPHAWDFTDAPLANKAFLGNQLADDGAQLRWIAPTDLYVDAGIELGRGRSFPAGPAGGRNKNGFGSANLFTHVGGDWSESTAWQLGASHLRTSPQDRTYEDFDSTGAIVTNAFTGRSSLSALSGVLKWSPNGNPSSRNFKLQGEFFRRDEDGRLVYDTASSSLGQRTGAFESRQSGWYAQGVYQFMPHWRVGLRYDRLSAGSTSIGLVNSGTRLAADFPVLAGYTPTRSTVMTDWSPSEFSRVRLQLAQDKSRAGLTDNQVFVQYIMSMGAHGAHKF